MPQLSPAVGNKLIKAYQKEAGPDATQSCFLSTDDIKALLKGKTTGVRLFLGKTTKGAITLVAKPEPKETKTKKAMAANVADAEAEIMVGTIDCPPICPKTNEPFQAKPKKVAAPKAVKKAAPAKKAPAKKAVPAKKSAKK